MVMRKPRRWFASEENSMRSSVCVVEPYFVLCLHKEVVEVTTLMPVKRDRGGSTYEESNVTSFVKSCVEFETNLSFYGVDELKTVTAADAASHHHGSPAAVVAVIGTEAQLRNQSEVSLPFDSQAEAYTTALGVVKTGSLFAVNVGGWRVLIGVVPTQSSRHNCPTRPDVITSLVQAALEDPLVSTRLDVYVQSKEALCIATAVARAADKKFSAKKGLADLSYTTKGTDIRVVFPMEVDDRLRLALTAAAESVQLCQRLVDAPTNLLDTTTFAEIAESMSEKFGFQFDAIRGEALREAGYGGLYGVGKAAEFPPALITLSYKPKSTMLAEKRLAMVGKGIVYDTGGLAIKTPRTNMCTMKHDMGGAAAVFCAFLAAVRVDAAAEIACVLCLADNAIGPRSQRNDDIVRMKSGLTIEINNTDAEGRLVLGDGVYHASALLPFTPDVIVDMATLTGAQGVATGKFHASLYTNSGEYEVRVMEAGRKCGDLVFPVVYCPEFHNKEFASKVADYKNSVANISNAQVSCAGQFIGNNLASDFNGAWVHVDLASPATRDEGTGYGVALALQTFFGSSFAPKTE